VDIQTRTITLPSGRTATLRTGRGRDLVNAHRAVASNPEPIAISFALIAELATIDDRKIVYEDLLTMDLNDVLVLESEIIEAPAENFPKAADQE
jgi:hypothetical protein